MLLVGIDPNAYACLNEATSITNPTLIPDRSDYSTGIGGSAANQQISLITISKEILRVSSSIETLVTNDALPSKGHLVALVSHLILSSTIGSVICISGNLRVDGFRIGYRELTAQTTLTNNDNFIEARADTGSFGIVLPTAVGMSGKQLHIKKCDASANAVVVSGSTTELIDGVATKIISAQYSSVSVSSNGTGWLIF
jgi:hypothetical protein